MPDKTNGNDRPVGASLGPVQCAFCAALTILLAFGLRMLEWPCWQNPEYRLGSEMLLATHDAYHWVAGATGIGLAVGHPMALMLQGIAGILNVSPANVAFWLPPVFGSLVAGMVFFWIWALGGIQAGISAGLIASIAPGFLGRTLLGYYDTDIITLFFPLLITLGPACWCMRVLLSPGQLLDRLPGGIAVIPFIKKTFKCPKIRKPISGGQTRPMPDIGAEGSQYLPRSRTDRKWICILAVSGIISFWAQDWHSVFPYLIRYNAVLISLMPLALAPAGLRRQLLLQSFAYSLPALGGIAGLIWPLYLLLASGARKKREDIPSTTLCAVLSLITLYLLLRGDILSIIARHINAYLKNSGDIYASGGASLVFPSVAQSIIEVQDLSLGALFPYFHPWLEASLFGIAGFILALFKRPAALFLLPLLALALLSSKLGGRMVMFGAPIVAIGITMPIYWLLERACRRLQGQKLAGWLCCILLCASMVAPFMDVIPALSQGPSINRRHAEALAQARLITPEDAKLWLWWDWGYAAHYFARRATIADGAVHGGAALYLPAAVFATDNPRFARQIIRYESAAGPEPGDFFKGLGADSAQELINRLRSNETALIAGSGRQYLIVSFEMLRLGFWISNFGNWNFITCQGDGGALSIVPQALAYKLDTGEVRLEDSGTIIFPSSITVFEETGIKRRNYIQEWFSAHPAATPLQQQAWLQSRRNVNFLFNRVTDEKLAMDEGLYNSLMVQLLVCDPNDARFTPYFKLVYDNVFARIYEVVAPAG